MVTNYFLYFYVLLNTTPSLVHLNWCVHRNYYNINFVKLGRICVKLAVFRRRKPTRTDVCSHACSKVASSPGPSRREGPGDEASSKAAEIDRLYIKYMYGTDDYGAARAYACCAAYCACARARAMQWTGRSLWISALRSNREVQNAP